MDVELVWIGPAGAVVREFTVAADATVGQVLELASRESAFAAAPLAGGSVGIFGRIAHPGERLAEGDRIEIYRGPAVDAKLARRARARSAKR